MTNYKAILKGLWTGIILTVCLLWARVHTGFQIPLAWQAHVVLLFAILRIVSLTTRKKAGDSSESGDFIDGVSSLSISIAYTVLTNKVDNLKQFNLSSTDILRQTIGLGLCCLAVTIISTFVHIRRVEIVNAIYKGILLTLSLGVVAQWLGDATSAEIYHANWVVSVSLTALVLYAGQKKTRTYTGNSSEDGTVIDLTVLVLVLGLYFLANRFWELDMLLTGSQPLKALCMLTIPAAVCCISSALLPRN